MAQARVEVGRLVHVLLQQFVHRRMQADRGVEVGVVARRIGADLDQVARLLCRAWSWRKRRAASTWAADVTLVITREIDFSMSIAG